MDLELDLDKSAFENAAVYYQKAKKAKRKLPGLHEAIEKTKKALEKESLRLETEAKRAPKKRRERDWYEKFHWTITSDGFLVIAGKDVKTNTIIVRKHLQPKDKYLHADIHGAPSTVVVSEGKEIPVGSIEEAARFAGAFSRAFSKGLAAIDVYAVDPDQVRTAAKAGEFLPKGGFQIRGEREWFRKLPVKVWVSWDGKRPVAFAREEKGVCVIPGDMPKGELAARIKRKLDTVFECDADVNDVIAVLPPGSGGIQ
jgi:predicted ribosome quality control (RQC) complex YloA/Tae2 family protein